MAAALLRQGTDRTDECLNIFLEFVPGGSICSLLSKFGAANPPLGAPPPTAQSRSRWILPGTCQATGERMLLACREAAHCTLRAALCGLPSCCRAAAAAPRWYAVGGPAHAAGARARGRLVQGERDPRVHAPDPAGPGVPARQQDHAPRHQGRQHPGRQHRPRQAGRLWRVQADREPGHHGCARPRALLLDSCTSLPNPTHLWTLSLWVRRPPPAARCWTTAPP